MLFLFLFFIHTSITETEDLSTRLQDYTNDIKAVMETEEYKRAEELIVNKQYEDAFSILSKAMLEHPEKQRAYLLAMNMLTNNVPTEEKNTCYQVFLNNAKEILPQLEYENQKLLAEFISGTESLRGNYPEASAYADALIQNTEPNTVEYANALYGKAIIAIQNNKYEDAMILLENLRRNKDYYPSDIQDKNDYQLFFVYSFLQKNELAVKLGEELRERFHKKEIKSGNDVIDRINLLSNLGSIYYNTDYIKAYEIYKELADLGDTYSDLLKKSGIPEISWQPFLEIARKNRDLLKPSYPSSNPRKETPEQTKKEENNQSSLEKPQTAMENIVGSLNQNLPANPNSFPKFPTITYSYPDYSLIKISFLLGFITGVIVILLFVLVVYFIYRKKKTS